MAEGGNPEQEAQPNGSETALYGAVAGLVGRAVSSFDVAATTFIEMGETYTQSFLRTDEGNQTSVSISVGPLRVEVSAKSDTFDSRDEKYGLPIPNTSDQYVFSIDTPTFFSFAKPEHPGRKSPFPPTVSFEHTELNKEGYSTQATIKLGGNNPPVIRHTVPLKQFDPDELDRDTGRKAGLVMLDDVMQDRGLTIPDTVKSIQPNADDISSFVDLVTILSDNFNEVIPAGVYYSPGAKRIVI